MIYKIKSKSIFILFIMFIFSFLLMDSCALKAVKTKESKKRIKTILSDIKAYNENIKSFRGIGYSILKDEKNTKTFRIETIFNNNFNDYKIIIKDFVFKKPIVSLLKKGGNTIYLYDYLKRKRVTYSNISIIFKKILNFDLPEGDLFIKTIGLKIPIPDNKNIKLYDQNSIELSTRNGKEIITLVNQLPKTIIYNGGQVSIEIKFSKIVNIGEIKLPSIVSIKVGKTIFQLNYNKLNINEDYSMLMNLKD